MGNSRRIRKLTFLTGLLPPLLFCTVFYGCGTSMTVMPDVRNTCATGFRVPGKIDYDGNRDYLPRILVDAPALQSPVVYRYLHAAEYGTQSVPDLLALFNPLTLVGFPTGGNMVRIAGKLDVVVDNLVVRSYSAGAALDKTRSLYAGETYTDLRKMGLTAVRDNIEAQLCRDAEYLAGIAKPAMSDNVARKP